MKEPDYPPDEAERLDALLALKLLDTPGEDRYDRITRLAQRLFKVPIALISLIDAERQWFKSRQGLSATETPRRISFCGHAILHDDIFMVPDTLDDPRFADNPLVTDAPDIRFYAGAPLSTLEGFHIGTLCLIDTAPRELSAEDQQSLRDLADLVQSELTRIRAQQMVEALHNQEARMRAIVSTAIDGIVTINDAGIVESFNPAAEHIFGYAAEEVLGNNVRMLMPEPYHSEHDGYLERFLRTREPHVIGIGREVVGRCKDGSTFPMDLAVGETELGSRRLFTGIIRNISVRKNAQRDLAARDAMQKAILKGVSYAIIATDESGTIRAFNPAAERMLGFDACEVIGLSSPLVFHDPLELRARAAELSTEFGCTIATDFHAIVARTARLGEADEREWTLIRKNGSRLSAMLSVTALQDSEGRISGFVGIAYDLTEQKESEHLKKEFISTVSHELRTPLTSIRGSLGLIMGGVAGSLPSQAAKLVEVAHRNSERLVRLINDMLDIEKIASGKMAFNLSAQALLPVITQAIDASRGYARELGVAFELHDDTGDVHVRIDSDRLVQVLTNLLANAAKFSPRGASVRISVQVSNGRVRIAVTDSGPGIPAAFQHRIFQKFSQADASDARQKGGTGLGLAISRALVEAMSGTIGFDSSTSGTCFWVELPCTGPATQLPSPAPERAHGARILVCEDDPDFAELIRFVLEEAGYRPDIAYSAAAAKSMLRQHAYDAMTLDIGLPDQDGISLIRELRGEAYARNLPVVVVTATRVAGQARLGGELAIADWLEKPVDHKRLLAALDNSRNDSEGSADRPRILHVEDDHDVHRFVEALIPNIATIDHAYDLQAARALLSENAYDLVILDLGLPDGSGWSLVPVIASKQPKPRVVVFSASELSGHDSQQFAACLLKSSTDNDRLLSTLRTQIQRNLPRGQ